MYLRKGGYVGESYLRKKERKKRVVTLKIAQ